VVVTVRHRTAPAEHERRMRQALRVDPVDALRR
jgi:hypothetical protein